MQPTRLGERTPEKLWLNQIVRLVADRRTEFAQFRKGDLFVVVGKRGTLKLEALPCARRDAVVGLRDVSITQVDVLTPEQQRQLRETQPELFNRGRAIGKFLLIEEGELKHEAFALSDVRRWLGRQFTSERVGLRLVDKRKPGVWRYRTYVIGSAELLALDGFKWWKPESATNGEQETNAAAAQ